MTVKQLKEILKDVPDEANVEVGYNYYISQEDSSGWEESRISDIRTVATAIYGARSKYEKKCVILTPELSIKYLNKYELERYSDFEEFND